MTPKLTIAVATFNRGKFIAETLDSILGQLPPEVELVVVDGASPDNTEEVMAGYVLRFPHIRYFREPANSGVDRDYDKAVGYARGDYCWLMTDDDLLVPGAVAKVLAQLDGSADLVLVNAEVRTVDFSAQLNPGIFESSTDRVYEPPEAEQFFSESLQGLTFIGSVVVRRQAWLDRVREPYYGTLFIHIGVIFQQPWPGRVKLIAQPQIVIRYGNAMWTARGFEIWMFKWPQLVWSFQGFSDASKQRVIAREPWRNLKKLVLYRALDSYGMPEYRRCWQGGGGGLVRAAALLVALAPARLVNLLASLQLLLLNRKARSSVYDLARSVHSTWVSRAVARLLAV